MSQKPQSYLALVAVLALGAAFASVSACNKDDKTTKTDNKTDTKTAKVNKDDAADKKVENKPADPATAPLNATTPPPVTNTMTSPTTYNLADDKWADVGCPSLKKDPDEKGFLCLMTTKTAGQNPDAVKAELEKDAALSLRNDVEAAAHFAVEKNPAKKNLGTDDLIKKYAEALVEKSSASQRKAIVKNGNGVAIAVVNLTRAPCDIMSAELPVVELCKLTAETASKDWGLMSGAIYPESP